MRNLYRFIERDLEEESHIEEEQEEGPERFIYVDAVINGTNAQVMLDTGSDCNAMGHDRYTELNAKASTPLQKFPVTGVTIEGIVQNRMYHVKSKTIIDLRIQNEELAESFYLIPGDKIILGTGAMRRLGCWVRFGQGKVKVNIPEDTKVETTADQPICKPDANPIDTDQEEVNEESLGEIKRLFHIKTDDGDDGEWSDKMQLIQRKVERDDADKVVKVYEEFKDIFSKQPGLMKGYECKLEFREPPVIKRKIYPIPHSYRDAVRQQVLKMLDDGIIEPAVSEYTSPLVVVTKKNGKPRVCLDARQINKYIVADHTTTENISEIFQRFQGCRHYSRFDLTSGYWQIGLHSESRKYVSFIYEGQTYAFRRMPFGLINSGSVFIQCMNQAIGFEVRKYAQVYVDDILIASETLEEHVSRLKALFSRLRMANLKLNLEKSDLLVDETKFLGYEISYHGTRPCAEKTQGIENYPAPTNKKQLQRFLGMCGYYRQFREGYARLTSVLTPLVSIKKSWEWKPEHQEAFDGIKEKFKQNIMLYHPNMNVPFIMGTDASQSAIGVELFQENGEEHQTIAFASRTLNNYERKYNTAEKELLAVVFGCRKFRTYLVGHHVEVRTDNKAITHFQGYRQGSGRLMRWAMILQQYNITWKHVKGKENVVADALSRCYEENRMHSEKHRIMWINEGEAEAKRMGTRIKNEQKEDPKLKKIIENIDRDAEQTEDERFHVHRGTLFIKHDGKRKVMIPEHMAEEVVELLHKRTGHPGRKRMNKMINRHYHLRKKAEMISKVTRGCTLCQQAKPARIALAGDYFRKIPTGKMIDTYIDLCGPLIRASDQMRFILVVTDGFSRYVRLIPIKTSTTANIFKKLKKEYFEKEGYPSNIITDRGAQFQSEEWDKKLCRVGIRPLKTTPYSPQSNICERTLKETVTLLRILCTKNHRGWSRRLTEVERIINSNYHEAIGMSPLEAHTGRIPQDSIIKHIEFPNGGDEDDDEEERRNKRLVYANLKNTYVARRKKHQRTHKVTRLKEGDLVLVRNTPRSNHRMGIMRKLCLLFIGPFRIKRAKGLNVYVLEDSNGQIVGSFNIRRLKVFHHA